MANFLFSSRFQKRYEDGKLVSVSRAVYDFQNIPIGPGDKESLDNIVVQIYIDGKVSFETVKQSIDNNNYHFKDRSECIDVTISFDNTTKKINSIEFDRSDINARFVFLESDCDEEFPENLFVDDISSREEMRNVYPERTYSDDKLEDEIDTYENRVETAQEYLEDDDDPTVRGVLRGRLGAYRQTLHVLLEEKRRRGI